MSAEKKRERISWKYPSAAELKCFLSIRTWEDVKENNKTEGEGEVEDQWQGGKNKMTSDTCILRNFYRKPHFPVRIGFSVFKMTAPLKMHLSWFSDRTFSNSKPDFGFLFKIRIQMCGRTNLKFPWEKKYQGKGLVEVFF